jgi:hypothetical protein
MYDFAYLNIINMKKKTQVSKLRLNKSTVHTLTQWKMGMIKGGTRDTCNATCACLTWEETCITDCSQPGATLLNTCVGTTAIPTRSCNPADCK